MNIHGFTYKTNVKLSYSIGLKNIRRKAEIMEMENERKELAKHREVFMDTESEGDNWWL